MCGALSTAALTGIAAHRLAAATPQVVEPLTLFLPDWGMNDAAQVRFGQVSLIHDSAGARLAIYRLSDVEPSSDTAPPQGVTPPFQGNTLLVADFASGNRNHLGGYFSTYHRPPSTARAALAPAPDGRPALRLTYRTEPEGFAGLWIHLFDATRPPAERRYLDARPFSTLSFWVRGRRGGERLRLKFADAEWEAREDALPVGELSEFLPSGRVEPRWQLAQVPMSRLPERLDPALLASVVLEAAADGPGQVYIGSLGFALAADSLRLPSPLPERRGRSRRGLGKATWVWNTAELLDDAERRARLLDFVTGEGFDRVFLQLVDAEERARPLGEIEPDPRLRLLVAALSRWGIDVYALDGFKDYALPEHHAAVLRTLENVIRYNEESLPQQRFAGIHHDIEPYLLPGFNGGRRELILQGYLGLIAKSARRAREAGLTYGVDIPFWYDAPDEYTYEPVLVEFHGVWKSASHHVIDLVDDVTVMDYRTTTFGADGTARHAAGELQYATEQGKPVYVGLETAPLPDEDLFDFSGPPLAELPDEVPAGGILVLAPSGDSTRIFLVAAGETRQPGEGAVELRARVREHVANLDAVRWWPLRDRVHVPGDKLSFHGLGAAALRGVIAETAAELSIYDSFAGFALHHAGSYMELLAGGR